MLPRLLSTLLLVLVTALPLLDEILPRPEDLESHWAPRWAEFDAQSDDGFLVWESARSGQWRIYRRELDGSGLAPLTPDRPGEDHFCPHLSPDGRRLAYLTVPSGVSLYDPFPPGVHATLRIRPSRVGAAADAEDSVLVASVRPYYEDRAVLWADDDRLFYIDADGTTQHLDLSSGVTTEKAHWPEPSFGWLPNATETHITGGWPTFSEFDPANRRILYRKALSGCQPYFSLDGVWGYWTGGAGGPLARFDLQTQQTAPIVDRHDARLPRNRRYVYFPMLSACQTAFAFAASAYEHDHFTSDYDVFVAAIDPFTLELTGRPLRYTFDATCDRFPDVHYCQLSLGKQRGMAPFVADFSAAVEGDGWEFEYREVGERAALARGATARFDSAGDFWVFATRGDERRRGRVRVDPPSGPEAVSAELIDERTLEIRFAGPVQLVAGASIELQHEDGDPPVAVDALRPGPDVGSVRATVHRSLRRPVGIALAGVLGIEPALPVIVSPHLRVKLEAWPVDPASLAFAFATRTADNLAFEHQTGDQLAYAIEPQGLAWYDRRGALECLGGSFVATAAAPNIVRSAQARQSIVFDLVIEPASLDQTGTIVALGRDAQDAADCDLWIGQRGTRLVGRLRVGRGDGAVQDVDFGEIRTRAHVSLGYVAFSKILNARVDGETVAYHTGFDDSTFDRWSAETLRLGSPSWRGTLHHVAAFGADRSRDEVLRDVAIVNRWMDAQAADFEPRSVRARLVAKSRVPTLREITPYTEAMTVFEYRAIDTGERFRTREWVLLNGQAAPSSADLEIGAERTLSLEPLTAHPQIEGIWCQPTLDDDFDVVEWFTPLRR